MYGRVNGPKIFEEDEADKKAHSSIKFFKLIHVASPVTVVVIEDVFL